MQRPTRPVQEPVHYSDEDEKGIKDEDEKDVNDEDEKEINYELQDAIVVDDVQKVSSLIYDDKICCTYLQRALLYVCHYDAIQCAVAIVNAKRNYGLLVYVNDRTLFGWYPLHAAAHYCRPSMTELFLYHGARTDFLSKDYEPEYNQKLPLNFALDVISISCLKEWDPEQSIFKLLTMLCIPRMQDNLETICLLAWTTKTTEMEFLVCVRDGKLVEVAALLMVARKKLFTAIDAVKSCVMQYLSSATVSDESKEICLVKVTPLLQLFDVFERAGDAFETYFKQKNTDITNEQIMEDVKYLLLQAGVPVKDEDMDFTDRNWFKEFVSTKIGFRPFRNPAKDVGMEHYSKSGYRWTGAIKVVNDCGEENLVNMPVASMPIELWGNGSSCKSKLVKSCSVHSKNLEKMKSIYSMPSEVWGSIGVPVGFPFCFNLGGRRRTLDFQLAGFGREAKNNSKGVGVKLQNVASIKPWASLVSLMKRFTKRF